MEDAKLKRQRIEAERQVRELTVKTVAALAEKYKMSRVRKQSNG
jgi:F0F1-type ATP synthase membrane subunit b/b'